MHKQLPILIGSRPIRPAGLLHRLAYASVFQLCLAAASPCLACAYESARPALKPAANVADRVLTGFVTDEKNEPLPGVTVVVKGTTAGATTDVAGKFQVSVPETG